MSIKSKRSRLLLQIGEYHGMVGTMKSLFLTCSIILLLAQPSLAQKPTTIPYGNNKEVGRFYDIRGFKMYCEVYGTGKPILMIHGNGGNMRAFSRIVPYFAAKYQVILADSRSQGKSKDPDHPLTFEMMADDFAALLDAMHIQSAYVIGWSDGGINALLLAMRHPEKVIALASTGANLWPGEDAFAPGVWAEMKRQYEQLSHKEMKTDREKNAWKLFMLDYTEPRIALSDLHKIQCPSLIICGDHDLISVPHTIAIFQNIPKAELWVVPNSGHGTLNEHREDFERQVDTFFSTPFHERKH